MTCLCKQIAGDEMVLSTTCIGEHWVFQNLSEADAKALSHDAVRKKMAKGEVLFFQGDAADEMFLIKAGRIKLNKVLEDGTEITLDIRKAGDFVGENALSEEGKYPVSAHCLEDTLTCGFSKAQLEQLVIDHPRIGLQIIKNLNERISWLTSHVGSLATSNIEDRLYNVISSVAREHGTQSASGMVIQFPLTHEELSFLTGAHRVSITRAMKTLKVAGKIILDGKQLIVPSLGVA